MIIGQVFRVSECLVEKCLRDEMLDSCPVVKLMGNVAVLLGGKGESRGVETQTS